MSHQRKYKRILAIVLSVLMLTLGIQQPAQAKSISVEWKQLANKEGSEEWINGNVNTNKSVYVEGMSVPQRLVLSDVTSGSGIRSVNFEYQFTKGENYAYDFITSWEQAKDAARAYIGQNWDDDWIWNDIKIIEDINNLKSNYVDIPVPTNNYATSQENAYEGIYGDRTIRIYSNEPITDVSINMYEPDDSNKGSDSTLGFTINWQGNASEIMILYASHLAVGDDILGWGPGNGAGGISGSSYHNYLRGSSEWTGNKSMDNQIQIDYDVTKIYGMKWEDTDKDGVKDNDEKGLKNWEIWADLNNNGTKDNGEPSTTTLSGGSYTLYVLSPLKGSTTARLYETQKSGYIQTYPTNEYYEVTIQKGTEHNDINFGNYKITSSISVIKTANPVSLAEPGGVFTYTFVVTNTGNVNVTLDSVIDDKIGVIALPENKILEPGKSVTLTGTKIYTQPGTYDNKVIATATDAFKSPLAASADATVEVTDIKPSITVFKTANPTNLPKGGGVFTFTYVVTNNGTVPVTVDSVFDDKIGDIPLPSNKILAPGELFTLTSTKTYTEAGIYHNTVTVKAVDEQGNNTEAKDEASVIVRDTDASITVTKTPNPLILLEPGGEFNYTYVITNNGNVAVTLKSVFDDKIGEIQLPEVKTIEPGNSVTLIGKQSYTDDGIYLNKVTVTAIHDDEEIIAETTASVTVTDTKPSITVTKIPTPISLPAPGGVFTYTFKVTNNGLVPVTIASVSDDKLGNLALPEDTELLPGESMTLTGTKEHTTIGIFKNTVTVIAVDDDNNPAISAADATVTVTTSSSEDPDDPDDPDDRDDPDDPGDPDEEEPKEDSEDEEPIIIPIDDTEVPLDRDPVQEPETPDEVIENTEVSLDTLPDTGDFFNNTILFATGSILISVGLILNKKKKIKE